MIILNKIVSQIWQYQIAKDKCLSTGWRPAELLSKRVYLVHTNNLIRTQANTFSFSNVWMFTRQQQINQLFTLQNSRENMKSSLITLFVSTNTVSQNFIYSIFLCYKYVYYKKSNKQVNTVNVALIIRTIKVFPILQNGIKFPPKIFSLLNVRCLLFQAYCLGRIIVLILKYVVVFRIEND